MKRWVLLVCVVFVLGVTIRASAADPFDTGQNNMTASEVLLNMGIYALTHPDSVKEALDGPKPEPKTKEDLVMDKKVDDAIKKAWGKAE